MAFVGLAVCSDHACGNGAQCVNREEGGVVCLCAEGYIGTRCESTLSQICGPWFYHWYTYTHGRTHAYTHTHTLTHTIAHRKAHDFDIVCTIEFTHYAY